MDIIAFSINLAGAIFMLLFGMQMVQTGIERSVGSSFKRILQKQKNYLQTGFIGVFLAFILQSATAAALLVAGFAASDLLTFASGFLIILGADIGSALVVQILSFRLEWLIPLFLTIGGWLFLRIETPHFRQIGRIFLGIALIFIGLQLIGAAVAPIRNSSFLPEMSVYLQNDFVTSFLLGVLLTIAMHSSIVTILMCISFINADLITLSSGISLILGANMGSAFLPVWLSRQMVMKARRLVFANLIVRGSGTLIAVLCINLSGLSAWLVTHHPSVQMLINVHLSFNVMLFFASLPFVKILEGLLEKYLPEKKLQEESTHSLLPVSALDYKVINKPSLALSSVTREVLRMSQIIEIMVRPVIGFYDSGDVKKIKETRDCDNLVNDSLHNIRHYVSTLQRKKLSEKQSQRAYHLLEYAINLETAGDIIAKHLLPLAEQKARKKLTFSKQGWNELQDVHQRVLSNMTLAFNVLISEDIDSARLLVEEKEDMAGIERRNRRLHIKRLNQGLQASFETSDIHLETLRGLKDFNSRISSIAYPILYQHGQLLQTKLIETMGQKKTS